MSCHLYTTFQLLWLNSCLAFLDFPVEDSNEERKTEGGWPIKEFFAPMPQEASSEALLISLAHEPEGGRGSGRGAVANAAASEGTVRGGTWSAALPPSSPEGPGPVQSKRLSTHISARRFLQIMSLGPQRDLKQESLHLIPGRPNTGGKDLSAHHVIDRDPDEIVGNETQQRFQPGRGDPWKATAMLTYDESYIP